MSWFSDFFNGGSTTKTTEPWKPAVAPLKGAIGMAGNLYNNRPAMYQGRFTAPNDPAQSEGFGWQELLARNLNATNPGQSTINLADKFAGNSANYKVPTFGEYDSSAIRPVIDALVDPSFQRYSTQVAPQLLASQDRSGAAHNSRGVIDNYNTADAFGREAGNIAATTGYQDFSDWRSLLNSNHQFETSQIPSLYASGYAQQTLPSQLLEQAGAGRQGLAQNEINNSLQQDQYNRNTPWQDFINYFNTLSTAGQLGSTQTVQENSNPLTQLMKLLGPALGSSTGQNATNWLGQQIGSVFNGSDGGVNAGNPVPAINAIAMSSRSFKENIEELSGQEALEKLVSMKAYKYNYVGDDAEYYGPMAEDFEGTKFIKMPQYIGLLHAVIRELAVRELARG